MSILVTGANGMVGRHMIHFLKKEKVPFIASSLNRPNLSESEFDWIQWDLEENCSTHDLNKKFGTVEAVFHIGALVPRVGGRNCERALFDINIRSCQTLAIWANENDIPIVYLSGGVVYQDPFKLAQQEDSPLGYSGLGGFYGHTKYLSEELFRYYVTQGLKLCILRPSSIYGYGLPPEKMLMNFFNLAKNGETIYLFPPIDDKINLIHALDVAKAMWSAFKVNAEGVFNIAYFKEYSIYDIAKTCINVARNGNIEIKNSSPETTQARTTFSLDIQKAKQAFGFEPAIDLDAGFKYIASHSLGI